MARSGDQKKRRIDFSTTTVEQKEKYELAMAESGMNTSAFIRMALDLFIDGSSAESPAEVTKDKEIARLGQEIERLRAVLSIKTRANENMGGELRRVRAHLIGDLNEIDAVDLAIQVQDVIEQAGEITHQELMKQIENPFTSPHPSKPQIPSQSPSLIQVLNDIESILRRQGKIVLLEGERIQWIG